MGSVYSIIDGIAKQLAATAMRTEHEILKIFPSRFSYDVMTGKKYILTHELDPPWDSSGYLGRTSHQTAFNLADYEKVADFFEEYTGNSEATYISGYGMHYTSYGEAYSSWFFDELNEAHFNCLSDIEISQLLFLAEAFQLKHNIDSENYNREDIQDLINGINEEVEEFQIDYYSKAEDLLIKISEMDFMFTFKSGQQAAENRLEESKQQGEKARQETENEKMKFAEFWSLLEKKYKLIYQQPFPRRIEKPDFIPFKEFLDRQNVSREERVLIAKYAPISFSNSVSFELLRP